MPSDNRLVEEGRLPGRPDVAYRWAHDETATAVTLKVLIDGQWRTLAVGGAAPNGLVLDRDGRAVARVVNGPDRRQTLVATVGALDRAVADLRGKDDELVAAPIAEDQEPRLCPEPTNEPRTTKSANSIAYQEYVSGLVYPLAIGSAACSSTAAIRRPDSCSKPRRTSTSCSMTNDELYGWIKPENNPRIQMQDQAEAALAAGRLVVWHAQTEKGYRGLTKIRDSLQLPERLVVSVIYDPN